MAKLSQNLRLLLKHGDLWLIAGLFGTVLLLILPIPPTLLDGLLALSIALSLLTLLVILYVRQPSDFSGFPTLLLFLTLFRLSLNVASTRLILLDGYAGHIIESFGNFVVRGNYVVGLVVFLILVLINFIVITKGAGRIAEVAARFTLDAMPGKQMAVDAELNAGIINETEARARRRAVEEEADFYGAMDGASKFVRGDAVAAILITLINVIGGFAIGIAQRGMTVSEALQRFTLLSIGDGLVSQIPALITSTAAGILVTRAASRNDLGHELSKQLLVYPRAMTVLAGMMTVFALVPGLPALPFGLLAAITGLLAYSLHRHGPLEPALAEAGPGRNPGRGGRPKARRAGPHDARGGQVHRQAGRVAPPGPLPGRAGIRSGFPGRQAARRGFAGSDHQCPADLCPRGWSHRPADSFAGQLAAWGQRIPLSAQRQPRGQGRIEAGLLDGHERCQEQDGAQGPAHGRAGLSTPGHVDSRCRAQERRGERLYRSRRPFGAGHALERNHSAAKPRDTQPAGCAGAAG